MTEIVDRVAGTLDELFAKHFCGTMGLDEQTAKEWARDLIKVMREPTPEMETAGWGSDHWEDQSPLVVWRNMIDAAL